MGVVAIYLLLNYHQMVGKKYVFFKLKGAQGCSNAMLKLEENII